MKPFPLREMPLARALLSPIILVAFASGQDDADTIFELVHNLATLGNTELNYISDFASPAQTRVRVTG